MKIRQRAGVSISKQKMYVYSGVSGRIINFILPVRTKPLRNLGEQGY